VASWLIRHNTWVNSGFAGLRFYAHDNARDTYDGVIHSNVIDNFQVNIPTSGAGVTWEQHHNVIGLGYATVDDYNVFSEFGTSTDTEWELANSGGISEPRHRPGVGGGPRCAGPGPARPCPRGRRPGLRVPRVEPDPRGCR
jgi:hypothetical protein